MFNEERENKGGSRSSFLDGGRKSKALLLILGETNRGGGIKGYSYSSSLTNMKEKERSHNLSITGGERKKGFFSPLEKREGPLLLLFKTRKTVIFMSSSPGKKKKGEEKRESRAFFRL